LRLGRQLVDSDAFYDALDHPKALAISLSVINCEPESKILNIRNTDKLNEY